MSKAQIASTTAGVVNCHCTPTSFVGLMPMAGLPPVGAPGPLNGIMIVVVVAGMVSSACGGKAPGGPEPLGSSVGSRCALSFVEYWTEQPSPETDPLMSNWTPLNPEPSMQSVPRALPLK